MGWLTLAEFIPNSSKGSGTRRAPAGNRFMNFKSYNLFMAIAVSLRETFLK
jgi:hypothetical protein